MHEFESKTVEAQGEIGPAKEGTQGQRHRIIGSQCEKVGWRVKSEIHPAWAHMPGHPALCPLCVLKGTGCMPIIVLFISSKGRRGVRAAAAGEDSGL